MMKRVLTAIFIASLIFCSQAYAIPITYSLSGTATAISSTGGTSSAAITGTMVIDSDPLILQEDPATGFTHLHWIVDSITIVSNVFQFGGDGALDLQGVDSGIQNYNEPRISGSGATPYFTGSTYIDDVANLFFNEDGSLYEDSISAYRAGLPYLIAPYWSGAWRFLSDDFAGTVAIVRDFRATRVAPPVPEPSTLILVLAGFIGLVPLFRKRMLVFR